MTLIFSLDNCYKRYLNDDGYYTLLRHNAENCTVKILKFGTPRTIAIIVLKIEKFDVTLH